jgi:uncharacterized protein YegL
MAVATANTPALVIYLLDVSGSMAEPCGNSTRIDALNIALKRQIKRMIQRSTRGEMVSPRYHVAMVSYSNQATDLLGGIKPISEITSSIPPLKPDELTNTAEAFSVAEELLKQVIGQYEHCPQPLICHMTDGRYTSQDPMPLVKRIKQMSVKDGNVLIENVFLSDDALAAPLVDPRSWSGISNPSQLKTDYAKRLFEMSSGLPTIFRDVLADMGYKFNSGARLLLPGNTPEVMEMAFAMSGMTGLVETSSIRDLL